jgi:Nif-specific regulatory protein
MSNLSKLTFDQLLCLQMITELVISEDDMNRALKETLKILAYNAQLNRGIISIYYKHLNEIHQDTFSFDAPDGTIKYTPGEGITGEVIKSGRTRIIPRLDQADDFKDKTGLRRDLDLSRYAFLCVPIKYRDDTIGAISVDRELTGDDDLEFYSEITLLEQVGNIISELVNRKTISEENTTLKQLLQKSNPLGTIVGNSKPMRDLAYQISLIADSHVSVLVNGETGTGKELVAKQIHKLSTRSNRPFITINSGAIPEGLIESELFGHKRGAFTGAVQDRVGKFEAANGGTLFLDEIGELPLLLQVKLLRAIQEKEITPVGDNRSIKTDVRIIAATNRNLEIEVEEGRFRADLYYRLNVFQLYLPPLRERGADIILLADFFIRRYSKQLGKNINRIDTPAIDMLMAYHWPGNVRELENCIERACLLADGDTIHAHHLPPSLQVKTVEEQSSGKRGKFKSLVRAYEIELITDALKDCGGNQTRAAELLETTKRIIQYKISEYNIDYRRFSKK